MRVIFGILDSQRNVEKSCLHCTYRCNIPGLGTDQGWGCMIRCAQMLQFHIMHVLSIKNWYSTTPSNILKRKFLDDENPYFSIQCFLATALSYGLKKMQWFGPLQVCHVSQRLLERYCTVTVFTDGVLYENEVPLNTKCLVAIPLLLGQTKPNSCYEDNIYKYMMMSCFSGILGGLPRHAMYFVGFSAVNDKKKIIGIDPHTLIESKADFPQVKTREVCYRQLDPSMVVTFFVQTTEERSGLIAKLRADTLINVMETKPSYEDTLHLGDDF